MDWQIEFNGGDFNPLFIHRLFYFLVSRGVKYNADKYTGHYHILSAEPKKDVECMEKEINESTEKLADIIDTYFKFDTKTTSLGIWLDYIGDVSFTFGVSILSASDNKLFLSFRTGEHLVTDEKAFLTFVNLCRDVFVRFNFIYGSFRSEYERFIPSTIEDFVKEKPNIVNFYSRSMVDVLGRERLLSAPALKVEELSNGGIMLLVCTEPLGCDNIYDVWEHLGYIEKTVED